MNCSLGCMKCLVFVFNVVYAIVGVALLSMGTIFFTQEVETKLSPDADALATETNDAVQALKQGALFFLITGVLAIVLAIIGCIGAIKENPLLMRVLAGILLLLALVQIIISGLAFAASGNGDILTHARQKISTNLARYGDSDRKYQQVQEYLEEKYHCCGSIGFSDYKNITPPVEIPKSCCIADPTTCDRFKNSGLKNKGCADAVAEKIVFLYKTVGAISTILYILEIIGAVGAYFLAVTILNAKRRGTFT
ncbi:hypothetical protein Trydic_g10469 [Trypoxylus dichotomus]